VEVVVWEITHHQLGHIRMVVLVVVKLMDMALELARQVKVIMAVHHIQLVLVAVVAVELLVKLVVQREVVMVVKEFFILFLDKILGMPVAVEAEQGLMALEDLVDLILADMVVKEMVLN
tara:strand:- start:164 stop:520 length:357 start_codon:yes stop_codon:yes gene_type:complete